MSLSPETLDNLTRSPAHGASHYYFQLKLSFNNNVNDIDGLNQYFH